MVPPNHISLLIADGRRAVSWELGLRREGLQVQRIATTGSDAAKGDYWLVVPKSEKARGQRFISNVLAGKSTLPATAPVSGPLLWGAAAIVLALAAITLAAALS